MFEDLIKKRELPDREIKGYPSSDKVFEVCSTCEHAKIGSINPRIHCTIAAGRTCANNLDDPFCQWKERS